jgi:hypothetical protein
MLADVLEELNSHHHQGNCQSCGLKLKTEPPRLLRRYLPTSSRRDATRRTWNFGTAVRTSGLRTSRASHGVHRLPEDGGRDASVRPFKGTLPVLFGSGSVVLFAAGATVVPYILPSSQSQSATVPFCCSEVTGMWQWSLIFHLLQILKIPGALPQCPTRVMCWGIGLAHPSCRLSFDISTIEVQDSAKTCFILS